MTNKEVTVLIAEDDELEIELIKRAFRKAKIANPLVFARDGVEALECLRGNGKIKPQVERPYIVLTDINMPRMGGLEFLEKLRDDAELSDSVVFVLTTSRADKDRCLAYANNVAGYILKDNVGQGFMKLIGMLDSYWKVVELPVVS